MTSKDHCIGRCQPLNAATQVEGKMLHLTAFQKFVAVLQDAFAKVELTSNSRNDCRETRNVCSRACLFVSYFIDWTPMCVLGNTSFNLLHETLPTLTPPLPCWCWGNDQTANFIVTVFDLNASNSEHIYHDNFSTTISNTETLPENSAFWRTWMAVIPWKQIKAFVYLRMSLDEHSQINKYCTNRNSGSYRCELPRGLHSLLVFTKSVDSNFRAFWLAPVTWNILGYSLFCERREKWSVVSRKFQKKKLWPLMNRHFFIHLIWLILKQLSPSGSVKSGGYMPRRFASRYISTTIHLPCGG